MDKYDKNILKLAKSLMEGKTVKVSDISVYAEHVEPCTDKCSLCGVNSVCYGGMEICDVCEKLACLTEDSYILVWKYEELFKNRFPNG